MRDTGSVLVWDLVVRVTHWSVAAIVVWELIDDSGGRLHRMLGYVAAGIVLARILWGFVGSEHARFRAWVPRPTAVLAYATALVRRRAPRFLSHTPLGSVMMLLMWALILALAVTGWMSRLDACGARTGRSTSTLLWPICCWRSCSCMCWLPSCSA